MPTRGTSSPGSEPSWPASSTGKTGTGSSAPWAGASTAASGPWWRASAAWCQTRVPPPPPPGPDSCVCPDNPAAGRARRRSASFRGGHPALPAAPCLHPHGGAGPPAAKGTWTSWRRCTKPPLQHWPRCPGQRRGTFRRSCAPMPPAPCSTCTAGAGSSRCSTSSSPCPPPCQTAAPWTAGPLLRRAASWSR